MNHDPIISVRELSKRFGDFVAVDRITFDVARGEIFGFLGANGRRENHGDADALRAELPHVGSGHRRRIRRDAPGRADQTPHRLHEPAVFALRPI